MDMKIKLGSNGRNKLQTKITYENEFKLHLHRTTIAHLTRKRNEQKTVL